MKRKVVVLTDCVDVAFNEIRGAIFQNASNDDFEIEPVVRVDSYNIENVNFLVKLVAEIYPEGTVICVIVNPLKLRTERIVGRTQRKNLIFEGTNTGAFDWLIKDFGCSELYELFDPGFVPFGGKYVHAPAIGKILSGKKLNELGNSFPLAKIRKVEMEEVCIVHIDNFGNLKLNHKLKEHVDGDFLNVFINGKKVTMKYAKRMMALDDGEIIIYPGSSFGFTEIGMVRGNFAETFNIKYGDKIKIKESIK